MITLPHPLESAALSRPEHLALEWGEESLSYAGLRDRVAGVAASLARQGCEPGHRVALVGPPSLDWCVTMHAVGWLGAVAVPLAQGPELSGHLERARIDLVLTAKAWPAPELPALPERGWPLEEVRFALSTSGTTGEPRIVDLTTSQILLSSYASATRLGISTSDCTLCCLPLHHVGGLSVLLRALFAGTSVVLAPFHAAQVGKWLDSGRITGVSLVPSMLAAVLDSRPNEPFPEALRFLLVGGGPTSGALRERCQRLDLPVALTWGFTEAASQVATCFPGELEEDKGCGPPLPFARVEEEKGRLQVRGPLVGGLSWPTGDVGRVDEKGRVWVEGRVDDMILSGGEMVDPKEIEAVLTSHPGIAEAAVIARSDEKWGERPVAFLVATEGTPLSEDELNSWCRAQLMGFKVPDDWRWCEDLPRTELGKLSRAALRKLESQLSQSVEESLR